MASKYVIDNSDSKTRLVFKAAPSYTISTQIKNPVTAEYEHGVFTNQNNKAVIAEAIKHLLRVMYDARSADIPKARMIIANHVQGFRRT